MRSKGKVVPVLNLEPRHEDVLGSVFELTNYCFYNRPLLCRNLYNSAMSLLMSTLCPLYYPR